MLKVEVTENNLCQSTGVLAKSRFGWGREHRHHGNPERISDVALAAGRLMKELGLVSCLQPAHAIMDYIVRYYSTLRPHEYNSGLPPNESENDTGRTLKW